MSSKKMVAKRRAPPKGTPLNKRQIKQVKRIIDTEIEDKWIDDIYGYTAQSYNTGLTFPYILTNIGQGSAQSQRVGDQIKLKSLELRMSVYHKASDLRYDETNSYRLIIFKWRETTVVAAPMQSDIVEHVSGIGTLNYGINSPIKWVNSKQRLFSILYDKTFAVDNFKASVHTIKLRKYLGNINFSPASAAGEGHLYLMVLNDDGLGVAPTLNVGFNARVIYQDA